MSIQNPASDTAAMQAYLAAAQIDIEEKEVVRFDTAVPSARFRSYLFDKYAIDTIAKLRAYTGAISIPSANLTDVTGIEYATNTTVLSLYSNPITALPVSELVDLTTLFAYTTDITELSAIHLKKLTQINIQSNNIELAEMEQVITDLWTNRTELGALSCVITLSGNPGSSAAGTSMATEINDLTTAGCTVII